LISFRGGKTGGLWNHDRGKNVKLTTSRLVGEEKKKVVSLTKTIKGLNSGAKGQKEGGIRGREGDQKNCISKNEAKKTQGTRNKKNRH